MAQLAMCIFKVTIGIYSDLTSFVILVNLLGNYGEGSQYTTDTRPMHDLVLILFQIGEKILFELELLVALR